MTDWTRKDFRCEVESCKRWCYYVGIENRKWLEDRWTFSRDGRRAWCSEHREWVIEYD
jgi:hypothetical protein